MSTSVDVNEPSASARSSTSVLKPQNQTTISLSEEWTIELLVTVALVFIAVAGIYLNYLVAPTDLPFLGQFIGS
jgi:hypothetical protein